MKHLNVGDRVLAGDGTYEVIYGFAHLKKTGTAEFLEIQTEGKIWGPLEVTVDHLVYVNEKFLPAKSIRIGDMLQIEGASAVGIKITAGWKMGLYAPLTPSGTLLVNGVKVSSYVTLKKGGNSQEYKQLHFLSQHMFIHMVLSPLRMACMGISPCLCSNVHIDEESGYPPVVGFGLFMADFIDQKNIMLQVFVFAVKVCFFGPFYLAESILGAAVVPGMFAGVVVIIAVHRWWKPNVRAIAKNLKLKIA